MKPATSRGTGRRQRGAALLLAMIILTLVSTLAAGMVWQQWRAIEVEAAERARVQSAWILSGALDWARLILREDARAANQPDHLGEPWAVPLAEARLSTFLAADRNATVEDDGVEAFLSGSIEDAMAKYNLRNVFAPDTQEAQKHLRVLQRLCERAGLPTDLAARLTNALRDAYAPSPSEAAPIAPNNVDQLAWLGLEAESIERLRPYVTILPAATKVNLNTAPPEVIAAVLEGVDLGTAQRIVEARRRAPLRSVADVIAQFGGAGSGQSIDDSLVQFNSNWFIVRGRLRLGERVLEEQSLVRRTGRTVVAMQRERVNLHLAGR